MSSLRDLPLQVSYRSDMGNLVDLFYLPCLERATSYHRAVGFFTSSGLAMAAKGIAAFIRGEGKMRLVASPHLDEEDSRAIAQGYSARYDAIARAVLRCFDEDIDSLVKDRLASLAWLIANERLEIKIAIKKSSPGCPFIPGIYHEKLGIFFDAEGNKIAFSGSSNETSGGLIGNFEVIDVFCSWDDPHDRVALKEKNFLDLWEDRTPKLEILPFPEAAYARLLKFKKDQPPTRDPESARAEIVIPRGRPSNKFDIPETISIRGYQGSAIKAWLSNEARGIFEMATGTGKTITSLFAANEIFKREGALGIIILAPFVHLVDQWEEIASAFGLQPIKCYEAATSWREKLTDQITDLNIKARQTFCAIATHDTASRSSFRDTVKKLRRPLLLIADEVHHLGAASLSQGLVPTAQFRLGLSATPERWFDPEGAQILNKYFDKTVFSFPLQQAIAEGYLCHYDYFPHLVTLEDDELQIYRTLSIQIARLSTRSQSDKNSETRLGFLLRERANVLNCARNKIDTLKSLVSHPDDVTHTLFYCAPGQIDDVVSLLAKELRMRIRRFTAEESRQERATLLKEFDSGEVQALVAMKCLDEGVDVPATRTAYILASNSNPREFIQRRGRILRTYHGKRKAIIHDLIAVPRRDKSDPVDESERNILRREFTRFKEFASAADNEYDAISKILTVASAFNVLDY